MVDPETADAALGILRSGEEQVRRASRRRELVMICGRAASTVLWLGRKDIRDPRLRRACDIALWIGTVGWAFWLADRTKVRGLWSDRRPRAAAALEERIRTLRESGEGARIPVDQHVRVFVSSLTPEQRRALFLATGLWLTRVLVVAGFRRSRLRYPHVTAGVVMAAASAAASGLRLRRRWSDDG